MEFRLELIYRRFVMFEGRGREKSPGKRLTEPPSRTFDIPEAIDHGSSDF